MNRVRFGSIVLAAALSLAGIATARAQPALTLGTASQGGTYNVYGDPQGKARPWRMDLVPLVIGAEEWARIERAVVQRVTLLNTILADSMRQTAPIAFATRSSIRPGAAPRSGPCTSAPRRGRRDPRSRGST